MKNKLINILKIVILSLSIIKSSLAGEVFNFDVTEIEIIENGNIFIGKKGGTATTEDGVVIKALNFNYDKKKKYFNSNR